MSERLRNTRPAERARGPDIEAMRQAVEAEVRAEVRAMVRAELGEIDLAWMTGDPRPAPPPRLRRPAAGRPSPQLRLPGLDDGAGPYGRGRS